MGPALSVDPTSLELAHVCWRSSVRIVPASRQPIALFELTQDPELLELADIARAAAEGRPPIDFSGLPVHQWVSGPGMSDAMTPFVFRGPSRFSDGTFGIYYTANDLETALHETIWHNTRRLRESSSPSIELHMRVVHTDLDVELHDLIGRETDFPGVDPAVADDYRASRVLGTALHAAGSNGLRYRSVRWTPGQCVGLFAPALAGRTHAPPWTLLYHYDADLAAIERAERVRPAAQPERRPIVEGTVWHLPR